MARVAFIGLGVMGYPMAGHLAAKGHAVTVYNRNGKKSAAWVAEHGGATTSEAVAYMKARLVDSNAARINRIETGRDGRGQHRRRE